MSRIFVISGPSGVGKGTLIKQLLAKNPNISLAISATTRKPRKGEINGKDYFFLEEKDFLNKIDSGEFIESCHVHDRWYGTLKSEVDSILKNGRHVVLEIDINGAMKIKEKNIEHTSIFILPPSLDVLMERLSDRNTEDEDVIAARMKVAKEELKAKDQYDFRVENHTILEAVKDLELIISKFL